MSVSGTSGKRPRNPPRTCKNSTGNSVNTTAAEDENETVPKCFRFDVKCKCGNGPAEVYNMSFRGPHLPSDQVHTAAHFKCPRCFCNVWPCCANESQWENHPLKDTMSDQKLPYTVSQVLSSFTTKTKERVGEKVISAYLLQCARFTKCECCENKCGLQSCIAYVHTKYFSKETVVSYGEELRTFLQSQKIPVDGLVFFALNKNNKITLRQVPPCQEGNLPNALMLVQLSPCLQMNKFLNKEGLEDEFDQRSHTTTINNVLCFGATSKELQEAITSIYQGVSAAFYASSPKDYRSSEDDTDSREYYDSEISSGDEFDNDEEDDEEGEDDLENVSDVEEKPPMEEAFDTLHRRYTKQFEKVEERCKAAAANGLKQQLEHQHVNPKTFPRLYRTAILNIQKCTKAMVALHVDNKRSNKTIESDRKWLEDRESQQTKARPLPEPPNTTESSEMRTQARSTRSCVNAKLYSLDPSYKEPQEPSSNGRSLLTLVGKRYPKGETYNDRYLSLYEKRLELVFEVIDLMLKEDIYKLDATYVSGKHAKQMEEMKAKIQALNEKMKTNDASVPAAAVDTQPEVPLTQEELIVRRDDFFHDVTGGYKTISGHIEATEKAIDAILEERKCANFKKGIFKKLVNKNPGKWCDDDLLDLEYFAPKYFDIGSQTLSHRIIGTRDELDLRTKEFCFIMTQLKKMSTSYKPKSSGPPIVWSSNPKHQLSLSTERGVNTRHVYCNKCNSRSGKKGLPKGQFFLNFVEDGIEDEDSE